MSVPDSRSQSKEQWAVQVEGRFGTNMLDPPLSLGTQAVKAKRVFRLDNFRDQTGAERGPLGRIHLAFKQGF